MPWNPFQPNGVTAAQINYLQADGLQIGRISQEIYNGVINGDLGVYGVKLPLASDGLQVVFGSRVSPRHADQHRRRLAAAPPNCLVPEVRRSRLPADLSERAVHGGPPAARARPGVRGKPLFRHCVPVLRLRQRAQTDTYKFGLEWAPVADVRLRASYQRAVRAANIVELFLAQGLNLFDAPGDPCGIAARDPNATPEECIATGVPASFYDGVNDVAQRGALDSPGAQYNFQQSGNANLTPESSDTKSFGVVLQPRWVPGLAITVDYFDIKIDDTISTLARTTPGLPVTPTTTRPRAAAFIAHPASDSCGRRHWLCLRTQREHRLAIDVRL